MRAASVYIELVPDRTRTPEPQMGRSPVAGLVDWWSL